VKTAISNIAWNPADDERVASWMKEAGVQGVEIAPTKLWPKPLEANVDQLVSYRRWWEKRGFPIVAMQALLFGRADLALFETQAKRDELLDYLERIMAVASVLGAGPLVFGSPKNRKTNGRPPHEVESIAIDFFRRAGDAALRHGVRLCIEPNPTQYECDWITCAKEGIDFVRKVDHPGFRLHLDAAGMRMSEDDIEGSLRAASEVMCHFHVSEPNLGSVGKGGVQHEVHARVLRGLSYQGWTSVEMRFDPAVDLESELRRVMVFAEKTYGF
jgi:D-psicose/D-tagatose/L-ribulose 3-epimerase